MCQGASSRFPDKHSQLVQGVPILTRTVNLVRSYTDDVTVIGPKTEFFQGLDCKLHTQADPGHGLLDGIFNIWPFWDSGALILLGDVVYSRQFLDLMMRDSRSLVMYGRTGLNPYTLRSHGERYGLRVSELMSEYLYKRIIGKTWRRYLEGRLCGLWHRIKSKAVWHECHDWTDDVDLPSDLQAMQTAVQGRHDY